MIHSARHGTAVVMLFGAATMMLVSSCATSLPVGSTVTATRPAPRPVEYLASLFHGN